MSEGITTICALFSKIVSSEILNSDVVWAAIIASALTTGGVFLTNRHSRKQQQEALKQDSLQHIASLAHDAEQRDKERKMSLRREVYLPAADAIYKSQSLLMQLLNLDMSEQEVAPLLSTELTFINKALVVGSDKTIQAVHSVQHELSVTFMDLVFKRLRLINRKHLIASLAKSEDDQQLEKLHAEQAQEHFAFIELGIASLDRLFVLIPPAFFAVREDMELPLLDKEAFLKTYNENNKKMKAELMARFQELKDELNI